MIRKEKKLAREEQGREMTKTCISWHCSESKEDKLSYKKQSGPADIAISLDSYWRMG